MAFAKSELSLMAYNGVAGGANHMWFYLNSAEDDVTEAGFFDDLLGTGDDAKPRITENDLVYVAEDRALVALTIGGTESEPTIVVTVIATPATTVSA